MKRKFLAFVALIAATLSLTSCLSSDETTVEYTYDTAITSFSLGSLDRYSQTKAGKDTLLKANVTGANYKFYIDQTARRIYNADSLPCGVRDSAVLTTISSKNSSPIVWMDIDKTDSIAAFYSSSDSVNFSKPRLLRVYNNAYTAYVTYTVEVNVHKEKPYEFKWHNLAANHADLQALNDLKALAVGNHLYVFGKSNGEFKAYQSAINDGATWTAITPNVAFGAEDFQNAVAMGGKLYILSDGKVYESENAETWDKVAENANIKQLIGAGSQRIYAYAAQNAGILVSKDKGRSWENEAIDSDAQLLPTHNLSICTSTNFSTKNVENLLLLGTRPESTDTLATIWTHIADYSANAPASVWNYLELDNNQPDKLRLSDEILACPADTGFVALADNGSWYASKNNGLAWKVDGNVAMPSEFTDKAVRFGFCRDANNFYWVIRNGYVWKGRFNKDGWRKE